MSILGHIAAEAIINNPLVVGAASAVGSAIDTASEKVKNRKSNKRVAFEKETAEYKHLWLTNSYENNRDITSLVDIEGNIEVSIHLKRLHSIKKVFVFDAAQKEIGYIKVKALGKYAIVINGHQIAEVKEINSFMKTAYVYQAPGLQMHFENDSITCDNQEIAKYENVRGAGRVLMYKDDELRFPLIMLVLTQYAYRIYNSENETRRVGAEY